MEIILELFFEIFGEIIIEGIVSLLSSFSIHITNHSKSKKILKYIISFLIFSGCLVLLILSLIYRKIIYVQVVVVYFLVLFVLYILRFINNNFILSNKFDQIILWLKRGIHYVFPIVLIVFASIYKYKGSTAIIICSSIALFIYFSINMYRIWVYKNSQSYSYETFLKINQQKIKQYKKFHFNQKNKMTNQLVCLYSNHLDYLNRYLGESNEEEFMFFVDNILEDLSKQLKSRPFLDKIATISHQFSFINIDSKIEQLKNNLF